MADTPWLRELLRIAATATPSTDAPWLSSPDVRPSASGGDLLDPDDPGKDPRFKKLVEAILWGRVFLQTYNLVLLDVLLLFTAWHWGEKWMLHRRKRRMENAETISPRRRDGRDIEDVEAWSSSSSTIEGSATPPDDARQKTASKTNETSPLLPKSTHSRTVSPLWRPYYVLKAWLQYQPRPIPIINKTLPTNATSLFVLSWLALIAFYNFYRMPLSFMYLFVFADRCGIIFISNLPLLYLLSAKNQPIKFLTGFSYESLNIFHRRVGEIMCFQAFLHFTGMWLVWFGMLRHLGFTLAKFVLNRVVLLGLAAFIAYEVIYFTSLGSFRQRWYEVFLGLHIVLQVAALVFVWFHHSTSKPYVGIALAIFLIDRLVYRCWLKSSTHPAELAVLEDGETILLSTNWDPKKQSKLLPKNMTHGWRPNDHLFISVPALSKKHALQSHPFTIFSAAPVSPSENTVQHAWLSLLIRAQADSGFTRRLLEYARTEPHTRIRLDGPYGSSHALDVLETSDTAILVAGGSGIAVAYPLLYALLQPSPKDPESTSTPSTRRHVKLLWITHAPEHCLWVPEEKMDELREWGLDVLVPPPTALAGRPDVPELLREWIVEAAGSVGVVVSGPDGLVRDVRNHCAAEIMRGKDVNVQVEKFGW